MDIKRVEMMIRESVACVRAMGWTLDPYYYVDLEGKRCCALGAVVVVCGRYSEGAFDAILRVLGFGCLASDDFSSGFFGGYDDHVREWTQTTTPYSLGLRLRRDLLEAA